jgi:two-component system sensor histidine kinase KdpD
VTPSARFWRWLAVLASVTLLLLMLRDRLSSAHVSLSLLLVVLLASADGGRRTGLSIAGGAFLVFNVLFLPPYGTLIIADPFDWLVLVAFFVTSVVASELLHRAQREAELARARAVDVERLAIEARDAVALREADRLKDALLASVSHDLRTPLTTIKALANDLASAGDERAMSIEEEADRLTAFVNDLLDVSQLRAGAWTLRLEPNEAEDLIGAALQSTRGITAGRAVRTSFDPRHPLLFARFDFAATLRIMANLLENAAKYSPAGAPIDIEVTRVDAELVLSVSDRGAGIAPAAVDQLFTPFTRGDTVRPETPGAGLGLAIAAGLARAQGGRLFVEPRDGGGSRFVLALPAVDPPTDPG